MERTALLLLAAGCSAPQLAVEPSYGRLDSRGEISLREQGQARVRNDLDETGLAGRESSLGLRADLKWGVPHLTLATQSAEWSGRGRVSEFGDIGGTDVAVDSRAEFGFHRALVTFDVLPGRPLELGLGLGISVLDIDWRVTEVGVGTTEDVDEILPVPVLALRLGLDLWRLNLEALLCGMGVEIEGDRATYLDLDLAARLRLFEAGPADGLLSLGYRRVQLELDYEDDGDEGELDWTLDGLYLGLRIRF